MAWGGGEFYFLPSKPKIHFEAHPKTLPKYDFAGKNVGKSNHLDIHHQPSFYSDSK